MSVRNVKTILLEDLLSHSNEIVEGENLQFRTQLYFLNNTIELIATHLTY